MEAGHRLRELASDLTGVRAAALSLGARFRGRRTEARRPERRRTAAIEEDMANNVLSANMTIELL